MWYQVCVTDLIASEGRYPQRVLFEPQDTNRWLNELELLSG